MLKTLSFDVPPNHSTFAEKSFKPNAMPNKFDIAEREQILQYGLWQDYGTRRETPRGNSGNLSRTKKRQRRSWFSRKYYASVMRMKEFYEENIGEAFAGIMSDFARRCNSKYWEYFVTF